MKIEHINFSGKVTLTAYLHDLSNELTNVNKRPGILILPGGGYHFCSDREAEPIALAYLSKGYNAFVLRYSVKEDSQFPRPLKEAEKALSLIRETKEWNVKGDQIACIGFSAGGHLASALGTMGQIRPNALILGYPCILEDKEEWWPFPIPGTDTEVDELTPETFIFHTYGDTDVLASNPIAFMNACIKQKIPVEFHMFRSGKHGLSLGTDIVSNDYKSMTEPRFSDWFELSVGWLNEVLQPFNSSKE